MEAELLDSIARAETDIVAMCRDLIRINTVNPYSGDRAPAGENPGQEYLAPILQGLGADIRWLPVPPDIYQRMNVLGPAERDFSGRPNLIAELTFAAPGPRIILNGHMDTVGIDSMPGEPLAAQVRDGRIHGRGGSDCKGGITTAVCALRALLSLEAPLCGSVVFQSVVDEECNGSGAGTLACLDAGYTGDAAVFVDGNDESMVLSCSGCLTVDVEVTGREGHAAYGTGVSALDKALIVKGALDRFKQARESQRPQARVNIGVFRAGVHPAVIPGSAFMSLNCVYEVDEAAQARQSMGVWGAGPIREKLQRLVREAEACDPWLAQTPSHITWVKDLIPFAPGPQQEPWAAQLEQAHLQVHGRLPRREHMLGWSDAAYPASLFNIPTLLYGPGVTGKAHSPDEYVEISSLVRCTQVLALFLLRTLHKPPDPS